METLPNITTDFASWYQEIVDRAQLADHSPVRGTMIIRPYGYAIWEHIRDRLDSRIKATGHQNAAFPLFIPESFLKKEATHVEGFAPEVAVVTHAGGKKLEEPLIVRPTSETIIHHTFARWISSWRDLPLKINQWANVVRWEMRPRPFLRTTEFYWQEGHTAHETEEEARAEVLQMLGEYIDLARNYLAIPVIAGIKTPLERFPGAVETHTFEGLMQDGKALQMGTSHLLSQTFAHAFEMKFQDRNGQQQYPYLTSWGATTRLIGAVIMVHGDQKGLILPPRIAPIQVVIVPILRTDRDSNLVMQAVRALESSLKNANIRALVDDDLQKTPGNKFYHWELRGVPLRIEIGPRDLEKSSCIVSDRLSGKKQSISLSSASEHIKTLLDAFHDELFMHAQKRRDAQWHKRTTLDSFTHELEERGGLYQVGWCGKNECEMRLKEHKASTRCIIPGNQADKCFLCGQKSVYDILIAKSY